MSDHSSSEAARASLREYRLEMTRVALSPRGLIWRSKELTDSGVSFWAVLVIFAPLAVFIYFTFLAQKCEPILGTKKPRRYTIAVKRIKLYCRYYGRYFEVTNPC